MPRSAFDDEARALTNADGYARFALQIGRGRFWSPIKALDNHVRNEGA